MSSVSITPSFSSLLLFSASAILLWSLSVVIIRLYFHSLSRIPGSKSAAASHLFELYYDIWLGGKLPWKLKELHAEFGPIIRIAPDEVHVADPDYANRHFSTRSDKPAPHQHRMGFGLATSETPDFETHKLRYGALAPSFSRRAVADLEPLLISKVGKVCQRLSEHRPSMAGGLQKPIDLRNLFLCMTTDTLTTFAFGFSFDLLDDPDLAPEWRNTMDTGIRNIQIFKHFPIGRRLLRHPLISSFLIKLKPGLAMLRSFELQNKQIARQAMAECGYSDDKAGQTALGNREVKSTVIPGQLPRNTIFHHLMSGDLPPQEKSFDRLWQEASSLMAAGSETTANALCFIIVQLCESPSCLAKLKSELMHEMPDARAPLPPWTKLESLPYFTAVINEGLRMALSVTGRMMRVLPADTEIHGYLLPKGTVVSVSSIMLHMDEAIWPEPETFRPERFLDKDGPGRKDLFTFSKGSRACLGMNLAYAELYLTLAAIIRRFDVKLFETSLDDVRPEFDGMVALPKPGSKGVRIVVE